MVSGTTSELSYSQASVSNDCWLAAYLAAKLRCRNLPHLRRDLATPETHDQISGSHCSRQIDYQDSRMSRHYSPALGKTPELALGEDRRRTCYCRAGPG